MNLQNKIKANPPGMASIKEARHKENNPRSQRGYNHPTRNNQRRNYSMDR